MPGKLVVIATHGPEDPEKATLPFVLATAAQALGAEALLAFQSNGVLLLRKGMIEHVPAAGFAPLTQLLDVFREGGGRFFACTPCLNTRNLTAEDLIEGVELVNAGALVKEVLEATNVLVY